MIENYGSLTTPDIVAASHPEAAYWDTNYQQPIDYNYAEMLKHKPPPTIFNQ